MKKFENLRVLKEDNIKHTKEDAKNEIKNKETTFTKLKNSSNDLKVRFDKWWYFAKMEWSDNLRFTIGASKIGIAVAIPAALGLYISGYGVMSLAGLGASVPFIAYGIFADAILYYDEMYC